jgi:hypothetical protein
MSGAVAAHAAYNGAGTQGLAVTNKINDTGDITSVFWTKNDTTRQLLHGSSLVEVVSSGSSGQVNTFGSSKIFTINNDVDVLGDMFLDLKMKVKATFNATGGAPRILTDFELDENFQYRLIDRVEFMVGTQIWHTLTGADIKVITKTCKPESISESMAETIASERFLRGINSPDAPTASEIADVSSIILAPLSGASEFARVVLWIPALSSDIAAPLKKFANITENGYLMAAAPQQSVKIKVVFKTSTSAAAISATINEIAPTSNITASTPHTYHSLDSSTPQTAMAATGAVYLNQGPYKRVVTGFSTNAATSITDVTGKTLVLELSIDRVRLFAKQLMLCKEERDQIRSVPNGLPYRIKMTQSIRAEIGTSVEKTIDLDSFSLYASHIIITGDISGAHIMSAELKLNSSSFSGVLPGIFLKNAAPETLHLYSGKTLSLEHVMDDEEYNFHLGKGELPMYVFPLASTAFSGSSVPLNRFDSIRLTLKFDDTPVTSGTAPVLSSPGVNVTCVGETTILYKGGSATLAMY